MQYQGWYAGHYSVFGLIVLAGVFLAMGACSRNAGAKTPVKAAAPAQTEDQPKEAPAALRPENVKINPEVSKEVVGLAQQFEKAASAHVGVCVINLASGKAIASHNADELLAPASNQKILSSALALAVLNGDYKFTTRVWQAGKDVIVQGDFDPTLGDPNLAAANHTDIFAELDKWAAAVKEKIGTKIEGDLIVQGAKSSEGYRHGDWPARQLRNWYAAPVAPLNFNNNCIDVTFTVTNGVITPALKPASRFIEIDNRLAIGKKQLWSLKGNEDDSTFTLTGSVVRSSTDPSSVAVNDPPMFLGRVLAERLALAGVTIGGKIRPDELAGFDSSKATLIASTETPLATVMARANKRSLNMCAEGMFLRSCGDWTNGPAKATKVLVSEYGLSEKSLDIHDGSGLSKNDRVTAAAMASLLTGIAGRKDAKVFFDSLPIAGTDGTMEHRLWAEPYKGRVLAKTGYINAVSCLSGYVLDTTGRPVIAYSVLVNGINGPADAKKLQDTICEKLVDSFER